MASFYRYPARSRRAMVDAMLSGRSYCGDHEVFPLNYTVKAYRVDLSFEHLRSLFEWGYLSESLRPGGADHEAFLVHALDVYGGYEKHLWEWGAQEAWRGVDDDTHRLHWDGERPFKVDFGLHGRSGGHLCVERFEGHDLRGDSDDLREQMLAEWSFKDVRDLYRLTQQWQVEFTGKNAEAEIEYQAAYALFANCAENSWNDGIKAEEAEEEAHLQRALAANV